MKNRGTTEAISEGRAWEAVKVAPKTIGGWLLTGSYSCRVKLLNCTWGIFRALKVQGSVCIDAKHMEPCLQIPILSRVLGQT